MFRCALLREFACCFFFLRRFVHFSHRWSVTSVDSTTVVLKAFMLVQTVLALAIACKQ
jgi:hypothetical protein